MFTQFHAPQSLKGASICRGTPYLQIQPCISRRIVYKTHTLHEKLYYYRHILRDNTFALPMFLKDNAAPMAVSMPGSEPTVSTISVILENINVSPDTTVLTDFDPIKVNQNLSTSVVRDLIRPSIESIYRSFSSWAEPSAF